MLKGEIWRDSKGEPLRFQDGDPVRIHWMEPRNPVVPDQFNEGWVRGFDLVEQDGEIQAAFDVFYMGTTLLIKDGGLSKLPHPPLPHDHHNGHGCGICGAAGA